ncbi:hypothetical protein CYLTODRAFT_359709 [Cylindrobasidium torrendii FP15055 ss-10]|uniref:Nucleotidyltransferase family protein n=1 Tax=Cylindrobasidium torrendii FP15055 ss-10 TaxID=1314674 RepID=A0A0D7AZ00_9AGAR|nr:hypothetical protein CYLTODRAFT_359709 [Cylindrobasidium torrendii FP15055 ss-10]
MDTRRLLEAATALSALLRARGVPHAFYGSVMTAALANLPHTDDIACIIEGGQHQAHPFRRLREAVGTSDDFTVVTSPWTNRLHVSYSGFIPAIEIEILPAGETGPRRLDASTTMKIYSVPFLTISEFLRQKLKVWTNSRLERDSRDILFVLAQFWNRIDYNRMPEHEMECFVECYPSAAVSWHAVKAKYRA